MTSRAAGFYVAVLAAGCVAPTTRGMAEQPARPSSTDPALDELARVDPRSDDDRALLVVFPKSACSGSARTVFMDRDGRFFGAVGPGEAALFTVPKKVRVLVAASSVDITTRPEAWFDVDEIVVPPLPDGVLLTSTRRDARQCGSGSYSNARIATKAELEAAIGEADIRWLAPRIADGQAWLEEHRARVDVLLERERRPPPMVVNRRRGP